MTEKLYNQNSHLQEFEAVVTACEEVKDHFHIALDQTAFFPEGGGQSGDTGSLNGIPVFDTHEKNGEIWHDTREALPMGTAVTGELDWDKRFSKMQQHSGEHIVSGLVHARFGYDNVGFHLGDQDVTLDFNGPLTKEELQEIELAANQVIWKNLPIQVTYPSKEELAALDYRSKIEIEGQVRIVTIPGVDVCACCAPHVHHTGEIGLIKLTDLMVHRGGVRLTLKAGDRALRDYQEKETGVKAVSVLLSSKEAEILKAVTRVQEESFALRGRLSALQMNMVAEKASKVPAQTKRAVFFEEGLDANVQREFVNLLMPRCFEAACVFTGSDETGWRYVLGSETEDVRPLCKALNTAFQGKGGGKPQMTQGSLTGTKEEIQAFLNM